MCRCAGLELFIKHNTMTWMPGHEEGQRRFYHKHQCDFLTGLHWGGLLKIWPESLISLSLCCNLLHGSEEIGYILMLQMWLFLILFFFLFGKHHDIHVIFLSLANAGSFLTVVRHQEQKPITWEIKAMFSSLNPRDKIRQHSERPRVALPFFMMVWINYSVSGIPG